MREHTDTEQKIFAAALEVFSEQGRGAARMQDIAERAGINKALVHYYFRSKDRLYEEVFEYLITNYFAMIGRTIVDSDTFEETLRKFIDTFLDILSEHPHFPRFMLRELSDGFPAFADKFRKLFDAGEFATPGAFITQFKRAVKKKEIVALDPLQTLLSLLGACVYFFAAYPVITVLEPSIDTHRARFIAQRKKEIFSLFYYGLQTREGH